MKAYIAGPMAGYENDNFPAFEDAVKFLEENTTWDIISPHTLQEIEHEGSCPEGPQGQSSHTGPCHMRTDIEALAHCDVIVLLTGWPKSSGAKAELQVALATGKEIYSYKPGYHKPLIYLGSS